MEIFSKYQVELENNASKTQVGFTPRPCIDIFLYCIGGMVMGQAIS